MNNNLIVDTPSKEFALASEGMHNAEIVEVKDMGIKPTAWGDKHKYMFRYEVDELDPDGKPISCIESFNATLGKGSRLADRIQSLIGKAPGRKYDLAKLVGWKGQIVVEHRESDGKTYANITSVLRKKTMNVHNVDITDDDIPSFDPEA